jgi:hypothetical protein
VEFLQFFARRDVSLYEIALDAVKVERLTETFNDPSIQAQ